MIEILHSEGPFYLFSFLFIFLAEPRKMWVYIGGDTSVLIELEQSLVRNDSL